MTDAPVPVAEEGNVLTCIVDGIEMQFRNGYWGHVCAEPQDATPAQVEGLIREALAKEGLKNWPAALVLRITERDADRDQIELRRLDGQTIKSGYPFVLTWYWRSYRRRVGDDILQAVKYIAEATLRELRGLSPHDEIPTFAQQAEEARAELQRHEEND